MKESLTYADAGVDIDKANKLVDTIGAIAKKSRAALAEELRPLIERHREIWLRRNRVGGLEDSVGRLEKTLRLLAEE